MFFYDIFYILELFVDWAHNVNYSGLPVIRILAKSNLALTRNKIDFPWISFIHLL